MSEAYEFTKLSDVEATSELKDDDVVLVVQDGVVKRFTGIFTQKAVRIALPPAWSIGEYEYRIPHTYYDEISNYLSKSIPIIFVMQKDGMPSELAFAYYSHDADERCSSAYLEINTWTHYLYLPIRDVEITL